MDFPSHRILAFDMTDGFQIKLGKMLNHQFVMEHHTIMGSSDIPLEYGNSIHTLSANVQANSHMLLMGRIDTWKQLQAHMILPALGIKVSGNVVGQKNWAQSSLNFEGTHKGTDYVLTGTVSAHRSRRTSDMKISYTQSLTSQLAVGGLHFSEPF